MFKPLAFVSAALLPLTAQAFPAQPGNWEWPHTISWHDRPSNSTDSVEGNENICISQNSSADYPKSQADSLKAENCKIENFGQSGNKASFKAVCETMSFDAQYEKLNEREIKFTQTIYSRKGKSYTASGIMRHKNADTAACAE